jgi:hypothetical protein
MRMSIDKLWIRWVAANALGEFIGLGLTFAIIGALITYLGPAESQLLIMVTFILLVASGAMEATVVGMLQWWAMKPWFPMIKFRSWWMATTIGALVAYVIGYLPSTMMDFGAEASVEVFEPSAGMVLLLAALLGLVGGAILSFAQWLVLRKQVEGAGWWIPANMLAWAVGMPIIFHGVDKAMELSSVVQISLVMGGWLLVAGAIVGAVQGIFLVRIAGEKGKIETKLDRSS